MSFGKKKEKPDKKVVSALQSPSFYTPFGNMVKGKYTPIESEDQVAARTTTDTKLRELLDGIPTSVDISQMYNNPFYETMLSYAKTPIVQQYDMDAKRLNNQLSAQNQLGSSYDAYQRYLLANRYDTQYRQAEQQARLTSADAYQQSLTNALNTLTTLRNDRNAALDATFLPAKLALNYQQNMTPLQQTLANYYAGINRTNQAMPSTADSIMQATGMALQTAAMFL